MVETRWLKYDGYYLSSFRRLVAWLWNSTTPEKQGDFYGEEESEPR